MVGALVAELLRVRRVVAVSLLELGAVERETGLGNRRQQVLACDVAAMQQQVIALIDEIHAIGCVVKDIDLGLIDFPAAAGGEIVNLCWKLGEPSIEYWHRIDEGFAWRKPLRDLTV
jgi:hypothetical protein